MSSPALPPREARRDRLGWFVLLSIAVHGAWLALPLETRRTALAGLAAPALHVRLAPAASPLPPAAEPGHRPAARPTGATHAAPDVAGRDGDTQPADIILSPAPAPATPVDLDAVRRAARALAHETVPPPRGPAAPPPPVMTVESAIARATRQPAVVESRGAAGERVVSDGRTRCVTPLLLPHYLAGRSLVTECEVIRK